MSNGILLKSFVGLLAAGSLAAQVQAAPIFTVAGPQGGGTAPNEFPAGEPPQDVRDQNPAMKYLNFGKTDTGFIESFPAGTTVNGLTFATANDAAERDPLTFSVYGSNTTVVTGTEAPGSTIDLGGFTLIAADQPTGLEGLAASRLTPGANQTFASSTFQTYAVIFPTIRDPGPNTNAMQVGDATFTNGGTAVIQAANPVIGGQSVIPEPASLGLIGLGSLGLLARRRRA